MALQRHHKHLIGLTTLCAVAVFTLFTIAFTITDAPQDADGEVEYTTNTTASAKGAKGTTNTEATLITKTGDEQQFSTDTTIAQVPFSYKSDRLANDEVSLRPCFRTVDADGNVVYREGNECVSVTDHGLANHKKVHIWNNSSNNLELIARNPYDPFNPQPVLHYNMLDHESSLALFKCIEVTDKSSAANKYLRGTSWLGTITHPWQTFHFDFFAPVNGRRAWVIRLVNDAGNLPVGLQDETSEKNGNVLETKSADNSTLWVLEADRIF